MCNFVFNMFLLIFLKFGYKLSSPSILGQKCKFPVHTCYGLSKEKQTLLSDLNKLNVEHVYKVAHQEYTEFTIYTELKNKTKNTHKKNKNKETRYGIDFSHYWR